jgi:hypothetical protein
MRKGAPLRIIDRGPLFDQIEAGRERPVVGWGRESRDGLPARLLEEPRPGDLRGFAADWRAKKRGRA